MSDYYADRLAAERLRQCYETAPPRARAYLEAEIDFVLEHLSAGNTVLELGCGYGRVLRKLIPAARRAVGVDTSNPSLIMARQYLRDLPSHDLVRMDAVRLGFPDGCFDLVICIQNGISALGVDRRTLLAEAARVTRREGCVLFSSYAERFWDARLEWFQAQAAQGLIGEIDTAATGNGVIVCKDGFRATTVKPGEFAALSKGLSTKAAEICEVAGAAVFCRLWVK